MNTEQVIKEGVILELYVNRELVDTIEVAEELTIYPETLIVADERGLLCTCMNPIEVINEKRCKLFTWLQGAFGISSKYLYKNYDDMA